MFREKATPAGGGGGINKLLEFKINPRDEFSSMAARVPRAKYSRFTGEESQYEAGDDEEEEEVLPETEISFRR